MDQSEHNKELLLKYNKRRVNYIYTLYTERLATDPGIQSQLWFQDSLSHIRRYYIAHESADWCVLDYSAQIFLDDCEYRLSKWDEYQVMNN